jgi:hypothetical protein
MPLTSCLRSILLSIGLIGWVAAVFVGFGLIPEPLAAESMFVFEISDGLETIQATTFDKKGRAIGSSSFEVETDEAGIRRMIVTMAVEGGGRNVSEALFAPTANQAVLQNVPTPRLRLLEERAQATRADGVSLDLLIIDHVRGRVSCYPPNGDLTIGQHVDLPENDRVVNVPMALLFQPLVAGEIEKLRFQIALCRDGPVLYKLIAVRRPISHIAGREVVEIRYGPNLGKAVTWFASRLLPRYSFWFDARDGSYLGHRMPLHRDGPKILLLRKGLTPSDIGFD